MTRRWWILPVVLAALAGTWASWILLTGRAYLPRHTSARDLPYALARPDVVEQPFNRVMTDPMNLILPDLAFLKRELEAGRVPLWNHGLLAGVPHAANPIAGALYPPNWLVVLFDPVDFLLVSACLHVFLAGFFFHLFLLSLGVRSYAAAIGSLGFALGGWMSAHLHNVPLVAVAGWIPLGLAGIEWVLAGRRRAGSLALALSLAMQWVAGFPIFAVFGTAALALYALISLLLAVARPARDRAATGTRVLLAASAGLLLAAVQIVPTLDVRERAPRKGSDRTVLAEESFQAGVLAGVALPFWLGDAHEKPVTEPPIESDRDHAARHVAATLLLGRRTDAPPPVIGRINNYGERTLYAGAPILLLAACGLLTIRSRAAIALLAVAAFATLFALGFLPPDWLLRLLGLDVGAPGRAILVLAIAMPAFAALGLDQLLDPARRAPWAILRAAGLVLGLFAAGLAVSAFVARDASLHALVRMLRASGAPQVLGVAADRPDADYARDLLPVFERLRLDLARLAFFTIAAWGVLEWWRRAARAGSGRALALAPALLGLVVVADLGSCFLRTNVPVARAGLFPETPVLARLRQESGRARFARLGADREAVIREMHVLFPPNLGLLHDLDDAQGYRDLVPGRYLRLLEGTSALVSTVGAAGFAVADAGSPVLDLASIRWLIAASPVDETSDAFRRSGLRRCDLGSDPARDVVLYENEDALPLAWAAHESVVMSDGDALAALREGRVDVRKTAIVDRMPQAAAAASTRPGDADNAVVSRRAVDSIVVDATLSSPGFVVIGESWDPGWRATLWHGPWQEDKGAELEIVRADGTFMAVWVPAGRQTIALRYWPRALSAGIGAAASGAALLLLLLVWPVRRRAAPEPPAAAA